MRELCEHGATSFGNKPILQSQKEIYVGFRLSMQPICISLGKGLIRGVSVHEDETRKEIILTRKHFACVLSYICNVNLWWWDSVTYSHIPSLGVHKASGKTHRQTAGVFFVFGAWRKNYAPIYAPFNEKYYKMTA